MQLTTFKASSRKLADSRANGRLRKQGAVPAVYYGQTQQPINISVNAADLRHVLAPGKRYTLLDLEIDGKSGNPALIYDYQKDALTQNITHIDFLKIDTTTTVKVRVPVRLSGVPVGVKTEGGMLQQENKYLKLVATPTEIPVAIEIDVSDFKSNTTFYARQLDLGKAKLASKPQTVIFTISKGRTSEEAAADKAKK